MTMPIFHSMEAQGMRARHQSASACCRPSAGIFDDRATPRLVQVHHDLDRAYKAHITYLTHMNELPSALRDFEDVGDQSKRHDFFRASRLLLKC